MISKGNSTGFNLSPYFFAGKKNNLVLVLILSLNVEIIINEHAQLF